MPAVKNSNDTNYVIEADAKVHTVTLDLNKLLSFGNANLIKYESDILTAVQSAEFIFTDIGEGSADICIDNILFTADNTANNNDDENKLSFFEKIKAFFVSLFEKIASFFEKIF